MRGAGRCEAIHPNKAAGAVRHSVITRNMQCTCRWCRCGCSRWSRNTSTLMNTHAVARSRRHSAHGTHGTHGIHGTHTSSRGRGHAMHMHVVGARVVGFHPAATGSRGHLHVRLPARTWPTQHVLRGSHGGCHCCGSSGN